MDNNVSLLNIVLEKDNQILKLKQNLLLVEKYLFRTEEGFSFKDFLCCNGFNRVGVYGYGKYGKYLYNRLKHTGVEFLCALDRNIQTIDVDIPGYTLDSAPKLDVIIISSPSIDVNFVKNGLNINNKECIVAHIIDVLDCQNFLIE